MLLRKNAFGLESLHPNDLGFDSYYPSSPLPESCLAVNKLELYVSWIVANTIT